MRLPLAPVLVALVLPLGGGCVTNTCVERGASTTYAGSASYDGQTTNPDGTPASQLAGAVSGTVVMDDFKPFESGRCDVGGISFTVRFGQCVLVAQESSENHDTGKGAGGAFIGATATIVSSLGCTLPLVQGPAAIDVQSGTLQVGPSSVELTLAGAITSLAGASATGQVQWTFTGQ